jgi:hypothetical protein
MSVADASDGDRDLVLPGVVEGKGAAVVTGADVTGGEAFAQRPQIILCRQLDRDLTESECRSAVECSSALPGVHAEVAHPGM